MPKLAGVYRKERTSILHAAAAKTLTHAALPGLQVENWGKSGLRQHKKRLHAKNLSVNNIHIQFYFSECHDGCGQVV